MTLSALTKTPSPAHWAGSTHCVEGRGEVGLKILSVHSLQNPAQRHRPLTSP